MELLDRLRPLALLLLRLAVGIIFVTHGYPKLFTNTSGMMQAFVHMRFPSYFVYIAGVLEFFGGLMLIAGLFTRIAAILLAGEMAVAIWRVHLPQGPITAVHNYEFPLALAVASFAMACFGAGAVSIDALIFRSGGGKPPRKPKSRERD
ncbi:MAG TPA: DoxX family protein [Candidatus Acidoferrum sp.]|nr:DoxX family protein [Candidatus Acidoferrum sp.]